MSKKKILKAIVLGGALGVIIGPHLWIWFIEFNIEIWTEITESLKELFKNTELQLKQRGKHVP